MGCLRKSLHYAAPLVLLICTAWYASAWQYVQSLSTQAAAARARLQAASSLSALRKFSNSSSGFSQDSPVGLSVEFLRSCAELVGEGGVYIYPTDEMAPPPALLPGHGDHSPLFPNSNGDWIDPLLQYSVELTLIRALQSSPYVTTDPARAKVFVIPQYATLEAHTCLYALQPIPANRLNDCAANISSAYLLPIIEAVKATPWYKRHNGSDHFWIFPWDDSWNLFPGVPEALASNHYFGYIGSEANLVAVPVTARFSSELEDAERNLILGGTSDRAHNAESLRHPHAQLTCSAMPPHKYLASFAGTVWPSRAYSKGLRQDLLEKFPLTTAEQTGIAFIDKHMDVAEYRQLLRDSIFCLSPQGWTPWSQRLFYAIAVGCIPVFFDMPGFNIVLPFSPDLDWQSVSVTVPFGEHLQVADILRSISPAEVCRMRQDLAMYAPYLVWSETPHLVLQGVLHKAWKAVKYLGNKAVTS